MRLSKRTSQLLGLSVIVLFFIIARFTGRTTEPPGKDASPENGVTLPAAEPSQVIQQHPESQFELNNFRRSSVKDGVKLWEVVAERGTYDPRTSQARLYKSSIEISRKSEDNMLISAESAVIKLNGNELVQAQLSGNVRTQLNKETTVYTEQALYSLDKQEITTQAPVKIENTMFDITANTLQTHTEDQIITLSGNVKTLVHPSKQHKQNKE